MNCMDYVSSMKWTLFMQAKLLSIFQAMVCVQAANKKEFHLQDDTILSKVAIVLHTTLGTLW